MESRLKKLFLELRFQGVKLSPDSHKFLSSFTYDVPDNCWVGWAIVYQYRDEYSEIRGVYLDHTDAELALQTEQANDSEDRNCYRIEPVFVHKGKGPFPTEGV